MKLDPSALRYLSRDELRVLTAVEMAQKNHELAPKELVGEIADLRHGGTEKLLRTLLRHKLLHHDRQHYDGYRLTTLGYDYLALRALVAKDTVSGVGRQIGVGKESDVFLAVNDAEREMVLKVHRLGRTSFRKIKTKRDYHGKRGSPSWLYLSRIAAQREFAYMRALSEAGFPVPEPIDANRHIVVMSVLEGWTLRDVTQMRDPERCAREMLSLVMRLAERGLIHGDFNEFNVAVDKSDSGRLVMYDFPQMISMDHPNARDMFERDVAGVTRFFQLRFKLDFGEIEVPTFDDAMEACLASELPRLDLVVKASGFGGGFTREQEEEFERCVAEAGRDDGGGGGEVEDDEEEEDEEDEEDEEEDGDAGENGEKGKDGEEGAAQRHESEEGDDDDDEEEEEEDAPLATSGTTTAATSGPGKTRPTPLSTIEHRAQRDVKSRIKRESRGSKTSRNIVKSREKRKLKGAVRAELS